MHGRRECLVAMSFQEAELTDIVQLVGKDSLSEVNSRVFCITACRVW